MTQPTPPPTTADEGVDPQLFDPAAMAWFDEHLTELREDAYGQRILYQTLAVGFVIGLAAYVAGYLLRSSATTELLGLLGDLIYTFGWACWTGVVVVVFVQLLPEAKRRQIKRALEAYEEARRDKARQKDNNVVERP
jgi:hypothetical protein